MTITAMTDSEIDRPVRQSITVRAGVERAFRVFTAEFDSWWPRSHHIGTSPMTKSIIEGRVGGRVVVRQRVQQRQLCVVEGIGHANPGRDCNCGQTRQQ
jgi:hypothetical protein